MATENRFAPRRPTIRDVAERAGVSKSLVSLVVHDSPRVSDKSRVAVLAAIDELGYRPSAMARGLVNQGSNLLGIVTADLQDAFFSSVLDGFTSYISHNELDLLPLVIHGDRQPAHEALAIEKFLELQIRGLILLGSKLPQETIERFAREVPVALVGRRIESTAVDVIVNDDEYGAELATRHLIELGHRRIVHTTGGDSYEGVAEREAGYRKVMKEAGLEPSVIRSGYTFQDGVVAGNAILAGKAPTGIVAANDRSAIGLMETLRAKGHHVPGDFSVVGYDDVPTASLSTIDLTTIHQPATHMGMTAARLSCRRLEDSGNEAQTVVLEPELVVRTTTRPI